MKTVNVENFGGGKNQFLIHTPEGLYFQSYDHLIAFKGNGDSNNIENIYLDINKWDINKITDKYRNLFLGDKRILETKYKIMEGKYLLIDLNNPEAKEKTKKSFNQIIKDIRKSKKWRMDFLGLRVGLRD